MTRADAGALRLAFLTTALVRAGAETQLVRIATALAARGHSVAVLGLVDRNDFAHELARSGIEVRTLGAAPGGRAPVAAVARLVRWLRAWRPTHLTAFPYHADVLARVIAPLAGRPVVVSSIRNEWYGGGARDRVLRATDRLADAVVVNSASAARALVARGTVRAAHLHVVPNALDPRLVRSAPDQIARTRVELGVAPDELLWLAVGRLHADKDHETLLAAVARLAAVVRERSRVVVSGEGPDRAALEDRARSLGVSSVVRFVGFRTDVPDLLSAADALVLSSPWEGSPNVVLEALACETPVVATDVAGVRELLAGDGARFVVPPRDATALAAAMSALAELPVEQRAALGRAGRAAVLERHALGAVVEAWEAVYRGRAMARP